MTATADYRCDKCQRIIERPVDTKGTRCGAKPFESVAHCTGRLVRVWAPVAIGRVQGAGESPSRTGRRQP